MKKTVISSVLLMGILFSSCSKEVDEDLNPIDTCNIENVSFQEVVLEIFNTNCNACHNADANFGGITLDNYADAKSVVDGGRLLGAIRRDEGFSPMPQNANKLSDCNIDKISSWVDEGAQNN